MGQATGAEARVPRDDDALVALLEALMSDAPDWPVLVRPDWHADAACREHPLELFFPRRRAGHRVADTVSEARHVCDQCLVREECRAWALERGAELRGIWAGLTEHDRQEMRRQHAVAQLARSA